MTTWQKAVKYIAMGLAGVLAAAIVGGIISIFLSLIGGEDMVLDHMETYTIEQQESITDLKVEISAADFLIQTGEEFSVESNLKKLTIKTENNKLVLSEKSKYSSCGGVSFNGGKNTPKLYLTIPADKRFDSVSIFTGAGKFTVEELLADTLTFTLGAGQVDIDKLTATKKITIDGGAGEINIKNGNLRNLDFNMGVGELNLTTYLYGNSELNCGVGEANVTLCGGMDLYTVKVDKGIGSIKINGQSIGNGTMIGMGENRLDIDGGIGSITVNFKE